MSIDRLIKDFGAVEGPNKALVIKRDGVITDMVAYWDAHAGYHRISDGGSALLDSVPAKPVEAAKVEPDPEPVVETPKAPEPVSRKLHMPGKRQ